MGSLSDWLKQELAARNWTQSRAADELGIPVQTLNGIIKDPKKEPEPATLRRFADTFGVSLEFLFEHMGYPAAKPTPQESRAMPEAVRGLSTAAYEQIVEMTTDELDRTLMVLRQQRLRGR